MNLRQKQILFKKLFRILELYAEALGYTLVDGMHHRSDEESARLAEEGIGINPSCHNFCLAAHLELFDQEGNYLEHTQDFLKLGAFWEGLHSLCRWGGRFDDGCHFSMEHNGIV